MEVVIQLTMLLLLTFSLQVLAENDWTKACFDGECSYDIDEGPTTMGGMIKISGSPSAISDITSAAGWDILHCTESANNQTILLACTDESLGCDHIFQVDAKDTIIRLPPKCGSGPFVRVVEHWIPDVNMLSTSVTSKLGQHSVQVHALKIDDDFAQMSNLHGNVSFEIYAQGPLQATTKPRKRQNGSGFENVTVTVPENSRFSFYFDQMLCPVLGASTIMIQEMVGDFGITSMALDISIGVVSRGTLNPPSITSLNFSAPTTGNIDVFLILAASVQGIINSVELEVVNIALPSFLIDGIMIISPSFIITLNSVGLVQLQTNLNTDVDFTISIDDLSFNYPTNSPPAFASISRPMINQFSISLMPSENSNVQIELNAMLQLLVQVSAFTQFVDLSVFYNVDHNITITALPSAPTNEEVCIDVTNTFAMEVSNDGPFFLALGSLPVFEKDFPVLSICDVVPLGPSPPITRFTRSSLYERDSNDVISCAPTFAVSQNVLLFQGSF
ncbi:hypothetical protein SCHPADRAFT_900505 [Schizopora paradoxa]|uniref:Uncharacterized protein n=1 Tax=Schizopora paradoxa TaxID=27342 RepID=A0A0H2S0P4_9AGAM|nr:hypothetical protein SCHPADRAFT_900505 [Schizopora paradoxa]